MPIVTVLDRTHSGGGLTVQIVVTTPQVLAEREYFRKTYAGKVLDYFSSVSDRFLEGSRLLYSFSPMRERMGIKIENNVYAKRRFTLEIKDPIFKFIEFSTLPHWPPLNRSSYQYPLEKKGKRFIGPRGLAKRRKLLPIAGSGIQGWASRHGLDPLAVQRSINTKRFHPGRADKGVGITQLYDKLVKEIAVKLMDLAEETIDD